MAGFLPAMPYRRRFFSSIVEHSQTPGALPLTFIATDGEALLGTVGLWRCDLISRQDLFPWMAALFVAETARGQGLAGKLQRHVIDYARQCGYPQLYLYSACRDFFMSALAGAISARARITRPPP